MKTIWFYSDPQFGDPDMITGGIKGDKLRPFTSLEEMGEHIVQEHNKLVKPGDSSYCLGDFAVTQEALDKYGPRMSGNQRLISGNHDDQPMARYVPYFKKIRSSVIIEKLLFTHIPAAPWSQSYCQANVHGHCHRSKPMFYEAFNPDKEGFLKRIKYINISMEHTNYRPVSLEEIMTWTRTK